MTNSTECGDNRFEIIQHAKNKLIEATNVESSPEEMKVLDNILFRMWQMGWLPDLENEKVPVVHAHWKLDPNGMDFGLPAWRCSNCGMKNTMIPSFIPTKHGGYVPKNPNVFAGSNYCPNCGAKMDEVEE